MHNAYRKEEDKTVREDNGFHYVNYIRNHFALYCNIIEYKNIHIHLVLYNYPLSVVGSCSLLKLKGISGYKIFIGGKMY